MKTIIRITIITFCFTSLLISQNPFWKPTYGSSGITSIASSSTNKVFGVAGNIVYVSTDDGLTWNKTLKSPGVTATDKIAADALGHIYVPSYGDIAISSDDGSTWTIKSLGGGASNRFAVLPNGYMFFGTEYGVYRSTDSGSTWKQWSLGSRPACNSVVVQSTNNIFAMFGYVQWGGAGVGFYSKGSWCLSSDQGNTWSENGIGKQYSSVQVDGVRSIFSYAITGLGGSTVTDVIRILPDGSNNKWNSILDIGGYNSLTSDFYGNIFIANSNGVSKWPSTGSGWSAVNSGLTNLNVGFLCNTPNGYLLASTPDGVFRSAYSLTTVKSNQSIPIPRSNHLFQNYPNPFNPVTRINFEISKTQFTTIKIFNIVGKEISEIVAKELEAGTYSKEWNGSTYPSGLYFCELRSGSYVETIKLILQK